MSVLNDTWIIEKAEQEAMIEPFARKQVRPGISFGVSSYGYDFRLADTFKVFDPPKDVDALDPKEGAERCFRDVTADSLVIPANSFVLARSLEYFRIPRDVLTICTGKSTYARVGVVVNVTPFEPEWEGFATVSLSNTANAPVRVYANEGIGQIVFLKAEEICRISYKDKKGKYQSQKDITLSKKD